MNKKTIIYNLENRPVAIIDYKKLHTFILNKVSIELSNLVEDCYYPKISTLYKELLYQTNSDSKSLLEYSKKKYKKPKWRLLHDPQTTLLVLIVQEFIKINDMAAAISAFNLFSLRYYTNLMHKYIKFCNPDYFRTALNKLSHNHLFTTKKTIGSSILYLSKEVFKRYEKDLRNDNADQIAQMIMVLRHRFNQSMKSFYKKYYEASEKKDVIKTEEEDSYKDETQERQLRQIVDRISKDICIYRRVHKPSIEASVQITSFNKRYANEYAIAASNPKHIDNVNLLLFLMLKQVKDLSVIGKTDFLEYIRRLMAVKVSKQPIYFKKTLTEIHNTIIKDLKYEHWYNKLSAQSKAVSRNFLAYYFSFVVRSYLS